MKAGYSILYFNTTFRDHNLAQTKIQSNILPLTLIDSWNVSQQAFGLSVAYGVTGPNKIAPRIHNTDGRDGVVEVNNATWVNRRVIDETKPDDSSSRTASGTLTISVPRIVYIFAYRNFAKQQHEYFYEEKLECTD